MVRVDFRDTATLPATMDFHLEATGSQIRIIVPPNVLVDQVFENSGSIIRNKRSRKFNMFPVRTRIHIHGRIKGSVIRIKTKKLKKRHYTALQLPE
ncbi:MAG: hypothetical protein JW874_14720 [Spirochaetales bacterium]|nr:hypothetical protein [Spirochaetales bacterium]